MHSMVKVDIKIQPPAARCAALKAGKRMRYPLASRVKSHPPLKPSFTQMVFYDPFVKLFKSLAPGRAAGGKAGHLTNTMPQYFNPQHSGQITAAFFIKRCVCLLPEGANLNTPQPNNSHARRIFLKPKSLTFRDMRYQREEKYSCCSFSISSSTNSSSQNSPVFG